MARQHTALPNHSEFERKPASLGPLPLPQRQLHRNLNYILDGKRIVDGHATRGTLTQEERTLLDNSYNFSVARNRQVLLGIGPEGNPLDRINLTKKLKVRDATSRATAFGQAVWTTSERIRKEEEERIRQAKREYFMRSEFESMSMGRASETRNHDESNMRLQATAPPCMHLMT
ncbi:hypothetical protein GG344DRAFT_65870 [Lentinula edodes]|nr:hypothetical protein GG344DRAFT_65870 [Lentinula edodes]